MALAPDRPGPRGRRARVAAQLLVAAFLVPSIDGDWFAARYLAPAFPLAGALLAWSVRHAQRVAAALGAVSLAITVITLVD